MAKYLDETGLQTLWKKIKEQDKATAAVAVSAIEGMAGQANGIASLDSSGNVPLSQLGNLDTTFAEVVATLPTSGIKRHLYLKAENSTGGNIYTEYLYTGNLPIQTDSTASDYSTNKYDASKWEEMGKHKAEVDLTPYAKKTEAVGLGFTERTESTAGVTITLHDVNGDGEDNIILPNATTGAPGVMSATDKAKLDGLKDFRYVKVDATSIEAESSAGSLTLAGSNVTLTPDATNRKVTVGITKANVTAALGYTPPTTNTTYSTMGAASASAAGTSGLVPAPAAGKQASFLRGDGTWAVPTNTTYGVATTSANGLMSAADKTKIDGIATGAEVNQNAFSKIAVGTTTVEADSKTDTLTLVGSNVTLTPDATNDKVTIGITKANVTTALGYTPPTSNDNWVHAVCRTASATAAKAATHTLYKLQAGNVFILTLESANTYQGQITLNVNSTGAKDVYLNGAATSSTNYSIPAGTYLVYYDGTNYHIRTDKVQPVTVLKANTATSATSATTATKLGSATVGSTTTPIYLNAGTPTKLGYTIAKSVPSDAVFTDTHYASSTAVGASNQAVSTTTSALSNGNVYLNHVENGGVKSSHKISGAGATTVTADASGNIIVTSTNTTYSAATQSAAGLMSAADKTKADAFEGAIDTATINALS